MKLKFILLIFLVFFIKRTDAQETDRNIRVLLERADWFGLDEAYTRTKGKIQSEILNQLSLVMLHTHFNRPEAALNDLDTLLKYHQSELGLYNVYDLIALKSRLYAGRGLYQEASENCRHFLNQLGRFNMSADSFPAHAFIEKFYEEIAYIPEPAIIRPDRDIELPLQIEDNSYGKIMYIPITVHGKVYRFIIDPGCDFTYISERIAKEMNVHVAGESTHIDIAGKRMAKCGAIDSMQLGEIVFKNVLIMIGAGGNEHKDLEVDAVLGFDFFRLIGETRLLPKKGKIIFPYLQTKTPGTGRNLMVDNNHVYIKTFSGKERLVFQLVTGILNSGLNHHYYVKHKDAMVSKLTKGIFQDNVVSGIENADVYNLNRLPLKVGGKKFKFKDIPVFSNQITDSIPYKDGILNMDFITRCKKVTLNFDRMFLEIK